MKHMLVGLMMLVVGRVGAATLGELDALSGDPGWDALSGKIRVALVIKAYNLTELATPTAEQLAYAIEVLANPSAAARDVIFYVIAANSAATTTQILGASDTAIQNNVDDAVDNLFAK